MVDVSLQLILGTAAILTASSTFACVLGVVCQTQFLDFGLALGTLLPTFLGTLITTDMYELGGEHITELAKDGLQES